MKINPASDAQGWRKMGTYEEPRLSEIVRLYEDLGFDVRIEPFDPSSDTECSECMRSAAERYQTVYTRKQDECPAARGFSFMTKSHRSIRG